MLEREIARARRQGHALAVLVFDVERLRSINDARGVLAGDFVLQELSRVLQAGLRRDQILARIGGDELALVLPETSRAGATALGEALRAQVREHAFVFQGEAIAVTIRAGSAGLRDDDRSALDLVERATQRLHDAERGGGAGS